MNDREQRKKELNKREQSEKEGEKFYFFQVNE